jgi:uncharacterized protein involved in exopolysaccharide biosynthesis
MVTTPLKPHRLPVDGDALSRSSLLAPGRVVQVLAAELRLLIWLPLFVFVLALAGLTLRSPRYVAESRALPRTTEGGMSRFAGIAAQFGFALPGGGGNNPTKLYVEMLGSQQLLRDALQSRFAVPSTPGGQDSTRGLLLDLLHVPGVTFRDRQENGVKLLRSMVNVTANEPAGTIRLRVTSPSASLSEQLSRRLLALLNESTLRSRREQASGEREFIDNRLLSAQQELTQAEDQVRRFLELNRQYASSPQLVVEYDRLRRRVDLRQQVFTALAQAYEQARIDEMRNTPVLTILDPPELTATKVGRKRDALVWLVIGFVLAVAIALAREAVRRRQLEDPRTLAELKAALRLGLARLTFRTREPRHDPRE